MKKIKLFVAILISLVAAPALVAFMVAFLLLADKMGLGFFTQDTGLVILFFVSCFIISFLLHQGLKKLQITPTWPFFIIAIIIGGLIIRIALNAGHGSTPSWPVLSQVRQLDSSLELYHNDHNSYPAKLEDLVPGYLGLVPNPLFPQNKICPSNKGIISYHLQSNSDFVLQFCLEEKTSGYEPGTHWLTSKGIQ